MGHQRLVSPTFHQFWEFYQVIAKNRGKFVVKKVANIPILGGQLGIEWSKICSIMSKTNTFNQKTELCCMVVVLVDVLKKKNF